jgi:isoquinoline 1-oxidoreductase beta subunit
MSNSSQEKPEIVEVPKQVETAEATAPRKRRWRVSRRGFLIGAGATAGLLAIGYVYGKPLMHLRLAESLDGGGAPGGYSEEDPFVWFEVLPDSRIRLHVAKIEMGQGVHTSLAQVAAEELGIGMADLDVRQATTTLGPQDSFGTSGSVSVSSTWTPLRTMGATLQEMLRQEAALMLGVPASALVVRERGFAVANDPAQRADFAAIVAQKQGDWSVPEVTIPATREWRVVGQPAPRIDIPKKLTGGAVYGYDARLPGMKYGAVLRPPTIEAKLLSVEPGNAAQMDGVLRVVIEDGFAGVVAETRAQAYAGVSALEPVWDEGRLWAQADIDALVVAEGNDGVTIQAEGSAPRLLADQTTHSAQYRTPMAVQTPLEAQAALADVQGETARIWVSTQMPSAVRDQVAEALGIKAEAIEVNPTYVGGGFGRKTGFESAVEAARLARAAGVPVHVGWSRLEEMRYGYFRPSTHHELFAQVSTEGKITALEHRQASGDVAFGFLPGFLEFMMGADFGATRGARIHYGGIPNREVVAYRKQLPVTTGWWRGLGLLANTFAIETFMDELAQEAGIDPIQFRLNHLGDDFDAQRERAVLERVAELSNWGSAAPAGRARGMASCFDAGTAVAQVAEVSVDDAGLVRVHNMWVAMDPGLVVNPDGAAAQVEGNVMWGVGSALLEEVAVAEGRVALGNFDTYPLLSMKQAPHVEVVLLEAGDGIPRGVGEPPIGPVAAAVGNALFALTGRRLRELPFTPTRVLAALSA